MTVYTLAAAKSRLGITDTTWDDRVVECIASAEATLADLIGPLEPTAVTETVTAASALVLNHLPVISLTSVTLVGGSVVSGCTLGVGGVVSGPVSSGSDYSVAYMAGRVTLPAHLREAVGDLAAHLFSTRYRGGPRRSTTAPVEVPVGGYLIPNAVAAAIVPHLLPGFG